MALKKPGKLREFLFLLLCGHPVLIWNVKTGNVKQKLGLLGKGNGYPILSISVGWI